MVQARAVRSKTHAPRADTVTPQAFPPQHALIPAERVAMGRLLHKLDLYVKVLVPQATSAPPAQLLLHLVFALQEAIVP